MQFYLICIVGFIFIPSYTSLNIFDFVPDDENFCDRIECEPIKCDDGYIIKEAQAGPRNCCRACVLTSNIGESCDGNFTSLRPDSCNSIVTDPLCLEGLICLSYNESTEFQCNFRDKNSVPCFTELKKYNDGIKEDWMWKPDCDDLGYYKPKQCKKYKCYCRLPDGQRIFGKAYADEEDAENMNCACSMMENKLYERGMNTGIFDHVVCKDNGNYLNLQCLQNLCFCVNETTAKVEGVILPKSLMHRLPCYDNDTYHEKYNRLCQLQRIDDERLALYYYTKGFDIGSMPLAKCDADGGHEAKQCDRENCRCVDPEGEQIQGSSDFVPIGEATAEMNCYCARDAWNNEFLGGSWVKPKCKNTGNYDPVQCIGRKCYCVDTDGHQIKNEISMDQLNSTTCEQA